MSTKKITFIDSNTFIACAYKEIDLDLDVVKRIKTILDENKMVLLLPEIIKEETFRRMKEKLSSLTSEILKPPTPSTGKNQTKGNSNLHQKKKGLIEEWIEESKKELVVKIDKRYKEASDLIKEIFNHKNTKEIKTTESLVFKGIKRALFRKPPFHKNPLLEVDAGYSHKRFFRSDQDCISFESLIEELSCDKDYITMSLIICTSDPDYYVDKDSIILENEIKEDLISLCKSTVAYRNPLEMLKKEFSENISKEAIKAYENKSTMEKLSINTPTFATIYQQFNEANDRLNSIKDSFKIRKEYFEYLTPPSIRSERCDECVKCGIKLGIYGSVYDKCEACRSEISLGHNPYPLG